MPGNAHVPLPRAEELRLQEEIVRCHRCPRLVDWRERIAREKVKRHREESYWGAPVPSFGPADAELLIVGLAPAAHGANRTGRMFTGDRSGDWLYRALHEYGFATQAESLSCADGLRLLNCRITAVAHCAPPANKLTAEEIRACATYLERELILMRRLRLIVALGRTAFDQVLLLTGNPRGAFAHGAETRLDTGRLLLASYHPSQQNTFTGRLTVDMFHRIFRRTQEILSTKEGQQ